MDETDIKALYRRHTQARDGLLDAQAADDIAATLSRHGWPAEDAVPLDRVVASATTSDIARIVAALGPDIDALAKDVNAARTPRRSPVQRFVRRGFALAAGIGAFAVLFSLLPGPQQVPGAVESPLHGEDAVIMAMSFESSDADTAASRTGSEAIFNGNFDS